MKCVVCRIKESPPGSILCGGKCSRIRLELFRLIDKYKPTNGCDNCLGDLHVGCTDKCKREFIESTELTADLYNLVRIVLDDNKE